MTDNPLWVERYRPRKVVDCVLPARLKATFQGMVDKGEVPNLTLVGRAGVGKTTVAKAMLDEIGADYMVLNASLYGNIDTLRTTVTDFASGISFSGGRKYVVLDEADYLTAATQGGLRNFIEEYSGNCGFILTANFQHKLIEPLWSRCPIVEFKFPKEEKPALALEFFERAKAVLEAEGVEHDPQAVAELVRRFFPDFRRVLNEMQRYASTGKIDAGILARFGDAEMRKLVGYMREKDFTSCRKWVAENIDTEPAVLFRRLYDDCATHLTPESIPQLVLLIAEYQDKATRVADQEINTAAFLVHVMSTCTFTE
jgi:DNA polymerase III delta prime subunit